MPLRNRGITVHSLVAAIAVTLLPILCCDILLAQPPAPSPNVTVVATGLLNPRGLKFGPDGQLYVAEGGAGGNLSTAGICEQVIAPVGPYTGGYTSRISRINVGNGQRTTVVDGLPSSQTSPALGSLVSGVADVAFVGNTLYAVLSGAGCSHGLAGTSNGVIRVNENGTWTLIADLSAFQKAHPVANPEPDDFEPDGTWYSMISARGLLYAVEPNHGELDEISPATGAVTRVVDISAREGHIVPTAIALHGNFYVGNLSTFPIVPGSSKILKINPAGHIRTDATGLTTVLGLAFDSRDRMYVLESSAAPGNPAPGHGRVVRVNPNGSMEVVATGLAVPSGMTMGPDGNLYVSNIGFGAPPVGLGQVVRIDIP
jgi:sugar lactone lactonase YvrE